MFMCLWAGLVHLVIIVIYNYYKINNVWLYSRLLIFAIFFLVKRVQLKYRRGLETRNNATTLAVAVLNSSSEENCFDYRQLQEHCKEVPLFLLTAAAAVFV